VKEVASDKFDVDIPGDDHGDSSNEGYSSSDSGNIFCTSGRRVEEITSSGIENAILSVLAMCPNHSCKLHSQTSRVLREVDVLARVNPRIEFEKRIRRCLAVSGHPLTHLGFRNETPRQIHG